MQASYKTFKNAVILHGLGSGPDEFWLPWLARELASAEYNIQAPQLPQKDQPDLSVWLPHVMQHISFSQDSVIVGHSAGCPLALAALEKLTTPVMRTVLVAGFINPIPNMPADHPMLLKNPDWDKIKHNGGEFVFIHSTNDPWGCTPDQGEAMRDKLGGTLITMTDQIHFGSNVFKQPYPDFPLVRDLCLMERV